jgi:hypothetical protein
MTVTAAARRTVCPGGQDAVNIVWSGADQCFHRAIQSRQETGDPSLGGHDIRATISWR